MTTPSSYNPTTWIDTASGNTPLSAANLNKIEQGIVNAYLRANQMFLTPTVIRTSSYTINPNDLGRFDATSASITSSLPAATVGALLAVKKIDSTANTVTFNPAGTDTIDGGSTTAIVLRMQNEVRTLLGVSGGWVVISGLNTITQLDLRYASYASVTALQTPPIFYAVQTASQSLTSGTAAPITFTTEVVDLPAAHSTSVNPSRYTSQQTGWYRVGGCVNFASIASPVGVRGALLYKNGAEYGGGSSYLPPVTTIATRVPTPLVLMYLAANDYVELYGYQTQGASLSTDVTSPSGSSLTVVYEHS